MLNKKDPFPQAEDAERALDRRRFLVAAGCATFLAAAGNWAAQRLDAASTPLDVALTGETIAPGEARAVTADDGREALVVRLSDGEVVAFDRRCPHLGCPVVWSGERSCFECPCHHAGFDARTGAVLYGPPRRGLAAATIVDRNGGRA